MILGTAYYPDYYPKSGWAADLDRMKQAGIGVVRILEFAWCWYQPDPDTFRWDDLDHFLDLCGERDLEVCLCTPTATAPPWFMERYPDARLVDVEGKPCFSHRHFVCWNHPGARDEALKTIAAMAERYGTRKEVVAWQIDNESNYAEKVDALYDFNPYTLEKARVWLKEKYGTLDALNDAWFANFWSQAVNSWDQIWSTHLPPVNPQSSLDFHRWRQHTVSEFVQTQAALLRERTQNQAIGTNIPEVGVVFSTAIAQDYWGQSEGMDWVGTDLYAATGNREADMSALRYSCDLMRSAAGPAEFLLAETQGGAHERTWKAGFAAEPWRVDYLASSSEVYAERGARQIWYFMWRPTLAGQEMGMNGVQDLDGNDTERTELIRSYARDDQPLEMLQQEYLARPLALIHYPQDTLRFLHRFGHLPAVSDNLTGVHRLLDQAGYRVDFINEAQLASGDLPAARVLALPESHLLSDAAIDVILDWGNASDERHVLIGHSTGLLDERGHLRPQSRRSLHQALGIQAGALMDLDVMIEIDGSTVDAFRVFEAGPDTEALGTMEWKEASYPTALHHGPFTLYSYPWGCSERLQAAHALPIT